MYAGYVPVPPSAPSPPPPLSNKTPSLLYLAASPRIAPATLSIRLLFTLLRAHFLKPILCAFISPTFPSPLSRCLFQLSHSTMHSAHYELNPSNPPLPPPPSQFLPSLSILVQSSGITKYPFAPTTALNLQEVVSSPISSSTSSPPPAVYDIIALQAHRCKVVGRSVYNANGHSICGVTNLRGKPCMRVGKCPFHRCQPISPENCINGVLDTTGALTSNGSTLPVSSLTPPKKCQYKRGWSLEEHFFFLYGLHMYGHGAWKKIAVLVQTRSAVQVQSHAQKFQDRQEKRVVRVKRSIHDHTLDSPEMIDLHNMYKNTKLRDRLRDAQLEENSRRRYFSQDYNNLEEYYPERDDFYLGY